VVRFPRLAEELAQGVHALRRGSLRALKGGCGIRYEEDSTVIASPGRRRVRHSDSFRPPPTPGRSTKSQHPHEPMWYTPAKLHQ
jgi:hypothetical protein